MTRSPCNTDAPCNVLVVADEWLAGECPMSSAALLVVESERGDAKALDALLEGAGYAVVVAENGPEALAVLEVRRCQLVILDLILPLVSAWDFLQAKRKLPLWRDVPVVVLTASKVRLEDFEPQDHVTAILTKPYQPQELLAVVGSLVGSVTRGEGAVGGR